MDGRGISASLLSMFISARVLFKYTTSSTNHFTQIQITAFSDITLVNSQKLSCVQVRRTNLREIKPTRGAMNLLHAVVDTPSLRLISYGSSVAGACCHFKTCVTLRPLVHKAEPAEGGIRSTCQQSRATWAASPAGPRSEVSSPP